MRNSISQLSPTDSSPFAQFWPCGPILPVLMAIVVSTAAADDLELPYDESQLVLWLRENPEGVLEPAVPVSHNGSPVGSFKLMEGFDRVPGSDGYPLTYVDLFANMFIRLTWQQDDGTSASLGTSVVTTPSYRTAAGLQYVPNVQEARVLTGTPDRVRVELDAQFQSDALITSTHVFPDPSIGRTETAVHIECEVLQDIVPDPSELGNDAVRLLTVESMFATMDVYDTNAVKYETAEGEIRVLRLDHDTPRGTHLFPQPAEIGSWFTLAKEPGSLWYPASPSISIDILDRNGVPGRLGLQGFLAHTRDPSDDSLTVWLEWMDAPGILTAGTTLSVDVLVTAMPTVRADFNADGHVDDLDFEYFEGCATGPSIPQTNPDCLAPHPNADLDGDGDVAQDDFGRFQRCVTGPALSVSMECDQSDPAESFNVEQMTRFLLDQLADAGNDAAAGGLPAAYATAGTTGLPAAFLSWAQNNALVYDASTMLVTLTRVKPDEHEAEILQIANALSFVIQNDPAGDGRIRDAYYSNDIRAPVPNDHLPSIRDGQTHAGNAAWAIIALVHAYAVTGDVVYLSAAELLGSWIDAELRADDALGGYVGGVFFPQGTTDYSDENLVLIEWRSVEHNIDLVAAFQGLADVTGKPVWQERADHARQFVSAPELYQCDPGYWYPGTTSGMNINTSFLAEDTASWPWLAEIRPCDDAPLTWAWTNLQTKSNGYLGIRFTNLGDGVVSESTAHLALALRLAGKAMEADQLLAGLLRMRVAAPNADDRAIVAAPVPGIGVTSGLGNSYYAAPHVAATAWTVLAISEANPFQTPNNLAP